MKRMIGMLGILLFVLAGVTQVSAVPSLINYQGVLTDQEGEPLSGTYFMTFIIYDAASGGNQLWTEAHGSVNVNEGRLKRRERGRFKGPGWHCFGRSQNIAIQGRAKLCVPRLVRELRAAYDTGGGHVLDNVDVGGLSAKRSFAPHGLAYLLGLLNSRLLRWFFPFVSAPFRGGWLSANRQFLSQLPIRSIDFSDPADKARHDQMVSLVQRMLDLHKKVAEADVPQVKEALQRQIDATDSQIDRLVYELYDLTEEEIGIVERKQR